MNIYNACMRLLPFLWFSMVFGMINSFLIVCFTMVQNIFKLENIYKILTKISRNGYKTMLRGKYITFTINTRENFTNYFSHNFDQLSIYDIKVNQVSADYNGYYRQESSKLDKYGFIWCLPEKFPMRLDVFLKFFHKISNFKLIFASKFQI